MIEQPYRVPFEDAESEFVEKRSRFISHLWLVETEEEAQEHIRAMKKHYHDARHNCWCYIIRDTGIVRYSDDRIETVCSGEVSVRGMYGYV